ncbi:MAG TPA: M23 family metallopeptidase [Bacteroidales bacterium]|nr:M23 family metallopeptidase [Bacteroidales bacterium]
MFPLKYFLFIILLSSNLDHLPKDNAVFIPPVKIPVFLSSNFGELRADHFHSGIDIKTGGVTGKEVVSVADGYIYRIGVSPTGFGKALYVKHSSGYSSVYAHLDSFTQEVETYVKQKQYENKSFTITLFPSKELFPVKKGDIIALSGNSGSSGGPHLHFEIRETDNELPVNPLLYKIGVYDNIPPVIEKLAIYPIGNTLINNNRADVKINIPRSNGKYLLPAGNEITISGKAGFGLKIHDLLNGSSNKCAAYSIKLEIDSTTVFEYVMDGFSFDESRFVNSHMDYKTYMLNSQKIQKAYKLPNDKLSVYKNLLNNGVFSFNDGKIHNILFTVKDVNNNTSKLEFKVKALSGSNPSYSPNKDGSLRMMPYNRQNSYVADGVSVNVPNGALYDTLYFEHKRKPASPVMYSDLHSIHNNLTPLQKPVSLSIKPNKIPTGKESKMMIVQLNKNLSKVPTNSIWNEGFLKAEVSSFGDFFVGIDTIAPEIAPSGFTSESDLSAKKELRIKIKDDFSGIAKYEPAIDGKWALFEYDPKNEVLIYRFDQKYISKGITHSLSLKVSDNRDNVSQYSCTFKW